MLPNRDKLNELRIEAYKRVEELEAELDRVNGKLGGAVGSRNHWRSQYEIVNAQLRAAQNNAKEVNELKTENAALKRSLNHAVQQLAKRKPDNLSDEEWRLILEHRGICF